MKIILLFIGLFIIYGILSWIFEKIKQYLDYRNYVKKLNKLAIPINTIDVDYLSINLSAIDKSYHLLTNTHAQIYFINNHDNIKSIDYYVSQEASHRRSKRKPKIGGVKRYSRYRRYY